MFRHLTYFFQFLTSPSISALYSRGVFVKALLAKSGTPHSRSRHAISKSDSDKRFAYSIPSVNYLFFFKIKEYNVRWIPDRRVIAGESQSARAVIDPEHRDIITSLVAGIKELPAGAKIEASRQFWWTPRS